MSVLYPPLDWMSFDDLAQDESKASDYSFGKEMIYVCFAWSEEEDAYRTVFKLAGKHGLGFFNVSSDSEEVWLPSEGQLSLVYKSSSPLVSRIQRLFGRE